MQEKFVDELIENNFSFLFLGRKRDDDKSNDRCVGNGDEMLLEAEEFCADSGDYGES